MSFPVSTPPIRKRLEPPPAECEHHPAMKFKFDWFLIGMAVAVLLAWLFPNSGAQGGSLHPELLTKIGVALIFFLHGLTLSFAALKAGTLRWPVHLVVQAGTFL